jgi:hypothetical protein
MRIDILLKPFKKRRISTGYTLTELIIGASISVVVIGAAGMGLMNLLQGNKTSTTEANRRTEVNRALEFISDETRKAQTIETNPSTAFNSAKNNTSLSFDPIEGDPDPKKNAQPILALNIPGVSQPVLYYISPAESTAWKGPRVIYRFGPNFNTTSGDYTDPTTPASWTTKPLIDRISDADSNPNCGGLTASPSANAQGFYACINTNGKTANLFAIAQLENDEDYRASTEVYARSQANTLVGNNSNKNFGSPPPNPLNPNGQPRTYRIKKIATSMGCNPDGDPCTMTITFKRKSDNTDITTTTLGNGDLELPNVTEEFYVVVTPSTTGISNPYTPAEQNNQNPVASTNTNQVVLLGDGYDPPSNPAWNPENNSSKFQSLKTLLGNQNLIQNNKITLPEKQYLLAFEIGQTDPTHPGFDMQDQVLLITLQ